MTEFDLASEVKKSNWKCLPSQKSWKIRCSDFHNAIFSLLRPKSKLCSIKSLVLSLEHYNQVSIIHLKHCWISLNLKLIFGEPRFNFARLILLYVFSRFQNAITLTRNNIFHSEKISWYLRFSFIRNNLLKKLKSASDPLKLKEFV